MNDISLRYHSGFTDEQKAELRAASTRRFLPMEYSHASAEIFEIKFRTDAYAPNHIVTLRTEVDGWQRDIHGLYHGGAWIFVLPKAEYDKRFAFKFYLDGTTWMEGGNLVTDKFDGLDFTEQQVKFGSVSPRHSLPYDGLRVREDGAQQALVRNCYHEDREFDVIVIGSGMGGGILADALTDRDPGVETLVLDIGCLDFATHIYNMPGNAPELDGRHQVRGWLKPSGVHMGFDGGVHMNLGGRSVFWSGVIPKMRDWELQHWPKEIADYLRDDGYARAEKLMRKHVNLGEYQQKLIGELQDEFGDSFEITNTPRACHQPEFSDNGSPPKSFISQSTGTFSTAELLVDSLSYNGKGGGQHLYVNLNHRVIELRREGNRIVEVICEDLVGNKLRTYRAKRYVLAAGSMESVRIALQSGLEQDHPKIGKGFTDHPAYFVGYDRNNPIYLKNSSPWAGPGTHARIFFYPATENGYEGAFFNVEIVINSRYWRERHADDDILEERVNMPRTTIDFKISFDAALDDRNYIELDRSGGSNGRNKKLKTYVKRVDENPEFRGIIERLSRRLVQFFEGPEDFVFGQYGGWGADGTPHHAGGSMRMGVSSDREQCVVDPNLKFLNIENLYACDVSVFPRIPAANPALTLAALALRLSGHLAKEVGK